MKDSTTRPSFFVPPQVQYRRDRGYLGVLRFYGRSFPDVKLAIVLAENQLSGVPAPALMTTTQTFMDLYLQLQVTFRVKFPWPAS
jgi:hypothetical protein